ncbi:MAG: hypothetical protein ABWZ75_08645 [Novosphingobium sp.]
MPKIIEVTDPQTWCLAEATDALATTGFHPEDEGDLAHAALCLRRLGNDRAFLGDLFVAELAARHREDSGEHAYGPQAFILSPPGASNFFLRANIWPSADEHMRRGVLRL